MVVVAQAYVIILSVLVLVGGIMGFVKAKSKASVIAGTISAALLAAVYVFSLSKPHEGIGAAFVVCLLLSGVFAMRLKKTKKFMPSGMLLALCAIGEILTAIAFFMPA
ncbi:MAG TPA: TMEM14 family protein [Chroococcales cyanobacterium]